MGESYDLKLINLLLVNGVLYKQNYEYIDKDSGKSVQKVVNYNN